MSFSDILASIDKNAITTRCNNTTIDDVKVVLKKERVEIADLPVLLSLAAEECLEELAQKSLTLTRRHFGNVVSLFTPFYISNYCENRCVYCSFASQRSIIRKQLTFDQIHREATVISDSGIRHILVLTGESPKKTDFSYIHESLTIIRNYFPAVAIEMYPLAEKEYGALINSALIDSLTIYQETYNKDRYESLHQRGPKANFAYRLDTPDRACRSQIRSITIGALLGLDDFRHEAMSVALHAQYIQKMYPSVELSLSFPRLCPQEGDFTPEHIVSDQQLVQLVTAFRLLFPSCGITMSTRESQSFRTGIMPLGVTKISAGVSTAVGGHSTDPSTTQFEIADHRSVKEMQTDLLSQGFQPVMHDWSQRMSVI